MFPLTIRPFAISFKDIMHTIPILVEVDRGVNIEGVGFVYAPISFYSSDIV